MDGLRNFFESLNWIRKFQKVEWAETLFWDRSRLRKVLGSPSSFLTGSMCQTYEILKRFIMVTKMLNQNLILFQLFFDWFFLCEKQIYCGVRGARTMSGQKSTKMGNFLILWAESKNLNGKQTNADVKVLITRPSI